MKWLADFANRSLLTGFPEVNHAQSLVSAPLEKENPSGKYTVHDWAAFMAES